MDPVKFLFGLVLGLAIGPILAYLFIYWREERAAHRRTGQ
jgi:hypothetical protein